MYTPNHFELAQSSALDLVEQESFGLLIGPDLTLTHLPFLLNRTNRTLFAHMARANPQWQAFGDQARVVAVFSGAHGYISPSWYESRMAVPTWNYEAVHVHGTVTVLDEATLRERLTGLVAAQEEGLTPPWAVPKDAEYQDFYGKNLRAIVGFDIAIEQVEGKAKLSQNRPGPDRAKVIESLQSTTRASAHALAERMSAVNGS